MPRNGEKSERKDAMPHEEDIYGLQGLTNTELLARLDRLIEESTDSYFDDKQVDAINALLNQRAPVMEDFDAEEWLSEFHRKFGSVIELSGLNKTVDPENGTPNPAPKPKRRFSFGSGFVAAAVILVLLSTATLVANAFGYNPIRLLFGGETIRIEDQPSGSMELPNGIEGDYRSLQEALDRNRNAIKIPTWIPTHFSLSKIVERDFYGERALTAIYTGTDGSEFQIRILPYSPKERRIEEIDLIEDQEPYLQRDGVEYFILTNMNAAKGFWVDSDYCSHVAGDLTEEDIQIMINSIFER